MTRCQHCGHDVENYDQHLPACPVVRMAFDHDFWPGLQGHYRLTEAEKAARKTEHYSGRRADKKRRLALEVDWRR